MRVCGVERQREPELHLVRGIGEAGRHDTDDGARHIVHHDLPADGGGVAVKALAPDALRQHHHTVLSGPVLAGGERPAEHRADSQHVEEVRGDARAADSNRALTIFGGAEVAVVEAPRSHTVEGARPALVEEEGGIREIDRRDSIVADHMREAHEPARLRVRQRLQHDPVHEAEDGGRRADAYRENEDHGRGEPGRAPDATGCEAKLGSGNRHPGRWATEQWGQVLLSRGPGTVAPGPLLKST